MVWPACIVQLANFTRCDSQVAVCQRELSHDQIGCDLHWLSALLHKNVDALQGTCPGSLHIRMNWWPELMALRPAFLCNITSCNNQCDILLCNHAPKVLECVVKRPLRRYNLPISNLAKWTIHKISIDVAINHVTSGEHAGTRHKNRSGVLERLNIDISVLFIKLSGLWHAHFNLYLRICALIKCIELMRKLLLCFPFRYREGLLKIRSKLRFDLLPQIMRYVTLSAWASDACSLLRDLKQLLLQKFPDFSRVLILYLGHPCGR